MTKKSKAPKAPEMVCNHPLVGMTVSLIRQLSDEEIEQLGFDKDFSNVAVVIQLNNKETGEAALVVAQRDPEGNGYGNFLVDVQDKEGNSIVSGLILADREGNSCLR